MRFSTIGVVLFGAGRGWGGGEVRGSPGRGEEASLSMRVSRDIEPSLKTVSAINNFHAKRGL